MMRKLDRVWCGLPLKRAFVVFKVGYSWFAGQVAANVSTDNLAGFGRNERWKLLRNSPRFVVWNSVDAAFWGVTLPREG